MKICVKCGVEKDDGEFRPNGRGRGTTRADCKECGREYSRKYNAAHPGYSTASSRLLLSRRPDYRREYLRKNPEKRAAEVLRATQYKKENPEKVNEFIAARKARKRNATPVWANKFFMVEIYDLAQSRTRATGFVWHVDHIVPLKSDLVCGLHVEHNLRVIPWIDNVRKKNYHWPDMPGAP